MSRSDVIANRRNLTIAEITRVVRRIASEVLLSQADGMPTDCVINTDNLHTIPKDRLRERITSLSEEKQFALASPCGTRWNWTGRWRCPTGLSRLRPHRTA